MNQTKVRSYLIFYLYMVVVSHILIGMALPWLKFIPIIEPYHQAIEIAFFGNNVPENVRNLHLWWMGLFGATVQFASIYMGLLVYVADKYKLTIVWKGLILGFLVWAPQDIYISLQYNIYSHLIMDILVLIMTIPVLLMLNKIDSGTTPVLDSHH